APSTLSLHDALPIYPHGDRPRDRGGDAAEGDGAHVAQGGGHAGQEADGRDHPVVQAEDDLAHEAALGGVPGLVVEALERLGEPRSEEHTSELQSLAY